MLRASGSVLLRLSLVSLLLGLTPCAADADGAQIVVEIEGLRTDRGQLLGALFRSRNGWTEEGHEVATCRAEIHGHHATCVVEDVEPGTYAFAFLHDEDADGALDRDWIGIPQEGFGFSNDAPVRFGPPGFDEASFAHVDAETEVRVHVRYGL